MTIQEIEDFFAQHQIPVNTELYTGSTITDPQLFVSVNIDVIKKWKGDLNKCPSYWHLCDAIKLITKSHSA